MLINSKLTGYHIVIVGANGVASKRITKLLNEGVAKIYLFSAYETSDLDDHPQLLKIINENNEIIEPHLEESFTPEKITSLGRDCNGNIIDAVLVTIPGIQYKLSNELYQACCKLRIPINILDSPELCTFTFLTTHQEGPLQIGLTLSGYGCKLSLRILREIVTRLPNDIRDICEKIQNVRKRIQSREQKELWLNHICEFWPLRKINDMSEEQIMEAIREEQSPQTKVLSEAGLQSNSTQPGIIYLVGSGPGSPQFLTLAAREVLQIADIVLADKLIPTSILDLVPRKTPLHIARKFPGNADKAQEEQNELALECLRNGQKVVRLKQGDPCIFGRGGEEFDYFKLQHGFECIIIPGISSALSALTLAQIPATQRMISDQVLILTGVGRKGVLLEKVEWISTRTYVILMSVKRLSEIITMLVAESGFPKTTACAILERSSCQDQRSIYSTLENIESAMQTIDERSPALFVVGAACSSLIKLPQGSPWVIIDKLERNDTI